MNLVVLHLLELHWYKMVAAHGVITWGTLGKHRDFAMLFFGAQDSLNGFIYPLADNPNLSYGLSLSPPLPIANIPPFFRRPRSRCLSKNSRYIYLQNESINTTPYKPNFYHSLNRHLVLPICCFGSNGRLPVVGSLEKAQGKQRVLRGAGFLSRMKCSAIMRASYEEARASAAL